MVSTMSIGLDAIRPSKSFRDLREEAYRSVPAGPGVYVVFAPSSAHGFTPTSCGGRHKGQDPVVEVAILEAKWVDGAPMIYIGKTNELRRRLREYASFGAGRPAGHYGGRYIWQLEGCQDLVVGWISTPDDDPRLVEGRLLEEFVGRYGRLPFANLTR